MLKQEKRRGVPEETKRIAMAAYPRGNIYMAIHDKLSGLFEDADFMSMYADEGKPAIAAWRLGLVCVMQYMEGLSDEQAADAVRSRIDWKYALELELTDAGFVANVLTKFRCRLLEKHQEEVLFERIVSLLAAQGHLKARGKQRTDSTHILAQVQDLNRLECVGETLRYALNQLAEQQGEWLQAHVPSAWYDRYAARIASSRLPKSQPKRDAWAQQVGTDGQHLLEWPGVCRKENKDTD